MNEEEIEKVYLNIRESLYLILSTEVSPDIRAPILQQLDDAVANNWDELLN